MFKDAYYNENKEVIAIIVGVVAAFKEEEGFKIRMGTEDFWGS